MSLCAVLGCTFAVAPREERCPEHGGARMDGHCCDRCARGCEHGDCHQDAVRREAVRS